MSSWPDINEEHYAFPIDEFFGLGMVACRRCGSMVARPMPDAPSPTSVELHDVMHERLDELWQAHRRREEWEAERMEREG